MKYLKSFENIKSEKDRELQEWDYVVIKTNNP